MACAVLLILIIVTIIACVTKTLCFKPRKQKGTDLPDQNQGKNQAANPQQQTTQQQMQQLSLQQPRMGTVTYDRPTREPDLVLNNQRLDRQIPRWKWYFMLFAILWIFFSFFLWNAFLIWKNKYGFSRSWSFTKQISNFSACEMCMNDWMWAANIFQVRMHFCSKHTVEIRWICCYTFWQKFRDSNVVNIEVTIELISRNIFQFIHTAMHTVEITKLLSFT